MKNKILQLRILSANYRKSKLKRNSESERKKKTLPFLYTEEKRLRITFGFL
jgi:hypothetical protein